MNMLLSDMKCIFFFRSFFNDTYLQAQYLVEKIFKTGVISNQMILNVPNIPDDIPTVSINDGCFHINIARTLIQIFYRSDSNLDYDSNLNYFLNKIDEFSEYIFEGNIVSRIGLINTSVYNDVNGDALIKNKFLLKLQENSSEISLSFNNIEYTENIRVNKLHQIFQNIASKSLFVVKDINTHGMQNMMQISIIKMIIEKCRQEFTYNIMKSIVE